MAHYVMVVDASRCMNCKACIVACQQRNHVPYACRRNWVLETRDENVPGFLSYQPGACMHCDNPVCVEACPTAATRKAADGSVVIDKERCIGCGGCIASCPYGARFRHPATGTADKCDYCREHAIPGLLPACVAACATHCRTFGDADNPDDPVSKLLAANKNISVMPRGIDTRPTLTYLNYAKPEVFPEPLNPGRVPAPLVAMSAISSGVTLFGGLSLFGVVGVLLKQLVWPSEKTGDRHGSSEELAPATHAPSAERTERPDGSAPPCRNAPQGRKEEK